MGFLKTGEVHSPFFLFIRHSPNPSDQDILDALGLDAYRLIEPDDIHHRPHVVIGHTDDWTVVADDYSYTLWHAERSTHAIAAYAARVDDAFICRWPDVDETFAFSVWRRGECVRSFDLVKPGWSDPVTLEESGQVLEIETEELASQSAHDWLKVIASKLGYVAGDAVGTFRVYAGPEIVHVMRPYEKALTNIPRPTKTSATSTPVTTSAVSSTWTSDLQTRRACSEIRGLASGAKVCPRTNLCFAYHAHVRLEMGSHGHREVCYRIITLVRCGLRSDDRPRAGSRVGQRHT